MCSIILNILNVLFLGRDEESPIHLKPTLARSATRRNTNKVPPIPPKPHQRDDDGDSAYAASLESTLEAESKYEVGTKWRLDDLFNFEENKIHRHFIFLW